MASGVVSIVKLLASGCPLNCIICATEGLVRWHREKISCSQFVSSQDWCRSQNNDMNMWDEWQVALMFQKMVTDTKSVRVTDVSKKEDRKHRPSGLNTVDMLKV